MATVIERYTQGHGPAFQAKPTLQEKAPNHTEKLHHVQTTLNYYKDPKDDAIPVTITDVSGSEDEYTLDGNGFQVFQRASKERDFVDDEKIKTEYYPEIEKLLKDVTGASKIFIFDHTIRRPANTADAEAADSSMVRGPVTRVHIDQSYAASLARVSHHLPDEAPALLQSRVQIINVWRPIKRIFKDPLAVADAHSVPDSDLVGVPLVYPDRVGETYAVRANEAHRWYFKYGLGTNEVMLIKCFDSKVDGRARRVRHTAFVDAAEEEREARESIEVRALVFHEDDRE
ncbi:hypothetical protein LTS18_006368 [Coniosporium uncinatum]|uniref:Uncharacterized protein n=1 Tax=Coniosporium uncinatum TaxID=93489 RepID=A0ACC3D3P7_9PEZI|nr:hypothetical protein LTS18_006368 [Coniosporium uncinatum]